MTGCPLGEMLSEPIRYEWSIVHRNELSPGREGRCYGAVILCSLNLASQGEEILQHKVMGLTKYKRQRSIRRPRPLR